MKHYANDANEVCATFLQRFFSIFILLQHLFHSVLHVRTG